jgi:protease I
MKNMARIAVLIGDMFEDVEYTEPAKAFKKAGHDLVHIGLKKKSTVKVRKGNFLSPYHLTWLRL